MSASRTNLDAENIDDEARMAGLLATWKISETVWNQLWNDWQTVVK